VITEPGVVRLVRSEVHDPRGGFSDWDVLVDGVRIGHVFTGFAGMYMPWQYRRSGTWFYTRKEAVTALVADRIRKFAEASS
jgi:hypothetical protein